MLAPARCQLIELDEPAPRIDWGLAAVWRIIATTRGVPCWGGWIVSPGRLDDPDAFLEELLSDARQQAHALALTADLQHALGITPPAGPKQTVSVIVCTHRRSHYLPGLLEALAKLSPPPSEVVVVDNDPGDDDCRGLVLGHDARYVREDRRGLDHARVAGLRAAVGSVVAFTDDDCVPPQGWLARVDELFADRSVDAVTGPAFAYELETPSQLRFEIEGGFNRGFTQRRFDWTTISPANSGAVGAGANMMFRRDRLLALGEVFPPELDAGTASETGGDLYALYRILDGGGRIVYDPGSYLFHRHRREPQALARAFRGYGTGIVAATEKMIIERRDPEALAGVHWLWTQYREALIHSFLGQRDKRSMRIAAYYLVGGITGLGKWPRALVQERARTALSRPPGAADAAPSPSGEVPGAARAVEAPTPGPLLADLSHGITASVIVPTIGQSSVLAQALRALPPPGHCLEIIVVDDGRRPSVELAVTVPAGVQVVSSGGVGAAAARNLGARVATGEVLIFMDDDLVAGDGLIQRHLAAHEGRTDVFMIGCSIPEPIGDGWAARAAALWWHDHFRALSERTRFTPTDMLSGNVSIRRERFWELGGFSESFGRLRREDWLFGATVLRAGLDVRFDRHAIAHHRYTLTTAGRLRAAAAEGRGDAHLASVDPEFAAILPADTPGRRARALTILARLLARRRVAAATVAALDVLERLRLRRRWLGMFHRAQTLAYVGGRVRGDKSLGQVTAKPRPHMLVTEADLAGLRFDGLFAPDLIVDDSGQRRVLPADRGRWTSEHARRAAGAMAADVRRRGQAPPLRAPGLHIAIVAQRFHLSEEPIAGSAAEGVSIHECNGEESLWRRADTVAASGAAAVVWVVMPDAVLRSGVVTELRCLSNGDRVAVTVAAPGKTGWRYLRQARLDSSDWLAVAGVPAIIGFRPDLLGRIGPLDLTAEAVGGSMGPGLDLARRAQHADEVVAEATVVGVRWQYHRLRPWRNVEWRRQRARGSQIMRGQTERRAAGMIQAGATIIAMGGSPDRPVRSRAAALAGLAHGGVLGLNSVIRGDRGRR